MYIPGIGISLVPHLNLNLIAFSPFALDTILIDRRNLFHCHIFTDKTPLNRFVLYVLFHTRSTFALPLIIELCFRFLVFSGRVTVERGVDLND